MMRDQLRPRPHLSTLALVAFMTSFVLARLFTTLYPDIVLVRGGYHIHHFWYGLSMLVIGGWLGISYDNERISRVAAIVFGAGGGLVGDEVGLLLTFGDYLAGITYTFVIVFATGISLLIFFIRYSRAIYAEFTLSLSKHTAFYSGVFLVVTSVAFISETQNITIRTILATLTTIGCAMILVSLIRQARKRTRMAR